MKNLFIKATCLLLASGSAVYLQACMQQETSQVSPEPDSRSVRDATGSRPQNDQSMAEPQTPMAAGYQWALTTPASMLKAGRTVLLEMAVTEKETGIPLSQLTPIHEKLAHLIIVSKDLEYFSHVHPQILQKGKMRVNTEFPREGRYIMYLQFQPTGKAEETLQQTLQVGQGQMPSVRLVPDVEKAKQLDGYTFRMTGAPSQIGKAAMVTLTIEKDGKPVNNIEPYLGAAGHAVLLSEDAESFLHVHPTTEATGRYYQSPLQFHTQVDKPGLYKMWIQTQINGQIHTVDFTFQIP